MKGKVNKDAKDLPFSATDSNVTQLVDSFTHNGPNGEHYVMAFEILGVNLLEIMKRYEYKGIPMHLLRVISK